MKSVVAILGSARKRGLTYTATRQFLDDLEAFGDIKAEVVFLSEFSLGQCRGCKVCFEMGEHRCPLKDDRDVLTGKIANADGVVLASPNYSFQVSAIMKTFLDRLGYLFHRPRFHGKAFTDIVVQGIYGGKKISKYLEFVGGGLGFNVIKGSCITAFEPMTEKDHHKMKRALTQQSARFYRRMSKPSFGRPSIFQLMMFRMGRTSIRLLLDEKSKDYVYFRDQGWFSSDYYYPTKLGPLIGTIGRSFDWLGAKMAKRRDQPEHPAQ